MDIKNVIAQRLRNCRAEQGLTAEEVAKRLNILPSRYSNWELAIRTPKDQQVFDLADLYNKPPAWIAGFSDQETQPVDTRNFIAVNQATINVNDTTVTLETTSNTTAFNLSYIEQRGLNENKLTSIYATDDSMTGLVNEGDELLIDRTLNTVSKVDMFAMLVNSQVWIRWIRPEIDGSYTIAAEDSAHYPDNKLTADEMKKLHIIGRVARISRDR